MDLSVVATPFYFAAMAWERGALRRRSATDGPSAADYTTSDTLASLGMGVLSLTTPLTAALVRRAVPGRGRTGAVGWAVAATAATAVVVTTAADKVSRGTTRHARRAARVAATGGVTAMVAGGLVACGVSALAGGATRQWRRHGQARDLGRGVVPWALAMVWWDFSYYWNHRLMHEVRALWAVHVPHHSSERYNLSTALRQPVAGAFGVFVPSGLVSRVGVRPSLVDTSRALNLIYQFWIHTDTVRSLGPAEAVLNTPSHHRVHHGSNGRYLDRNHGGIMITWDRLFGTFQREDPDDPVVYGLTRNVGTDNLWTVSTHEYREMFRDVAASTNWRDRLGFVLRGPGWAYRRRDVLAAATAQVG